MSSNKLPISVRDSNNELLRLICMLFVVLNHFVVFSLCPDVLDVTAPLTKELCVSKFLLSFCYVGVNCFVLISGYYSINFRWSSLFKLWMFCVVYGAVGYFAHIVVDGTHIGRDLINSTVLCVSHYGWWFVNCYFVLVLLSPIINLGLSHINQKTHLYIVIGLTVFQVYFGNMWQIDDFGTTGYNVLHFIYVYIIGNYIHKYRFSKSKSWLWLAVYIVGCGVWWVLSCRAHIEPMDWWHQFTYNNIFTLLASIGLFLFFQSFSFKSRCVNWLASGSLAAYLLQCEYHMFPLLFPNLSDLLSSHQIGSKIMIVIVISIIWLLLCCLIHKPVAIVVNFLTDKIKNISLKFSEH